MSEDAKPTEPRTPEELGFSGCVAEIDSIIRGLESDRIDVDDLSRSVSRATELIQWCQNRLTGAQTEVEEILERLDPDGTQLDDGDGPASQD
jgi:exodeoxyribonuclease VII small subunit